VRAIPGFQDMAVVNSIREYPPIVLAIVKLLAHALLVPLYRSPSHLLLQKGALLDQWG
jgi:hypothetical protein